MKALIRDGALAEDEFTTVDDSAELPLRGRLSWASSGGKRLARNSWPASTCRPALDQRAGS